MFTPTHPQPSAVALRDYNTRINKQILPDNTTITEWHVSDINGLNAVANVTTNAGVVKTIPIIRKDLSMLFPANESGYHVVDARWYDKFSGSYDGGQSQVITLLDNATRLNHTVGYTPDPRLEHALAWLWIKKQIYIPITDVMVTDIRTDAWVINHGITEEKAILDAYEITARDDSLGYVGSVKLVFSAVPSVEGFEFTVISPTVENTGAYFAVTMNQVAGDWKVFENDRLVVAPGINTIGATVTSTVGKIVIVFNNLKATTKTYVIQGTCSLLRMDNHVATTRNVVIKSFLNTAQRYEFNLPTVDLTVPTTLPVFLTTLKAMFTGCTYFNQDISMWDVSNVTDFSQLFSGCIAFNKPLATWNMSNATNISSMFYSCNAFNQPINNWDTSRVTNMSNAFNRAVVFNRLLNNWNTSSVTDMSFMFAGCAAFNQDLNNWNVSKVTNMNSMFGNTTLMFNGDITTWDVSSVKTMSSMFNGARKFNRDIGAWNVSNVTDMSYLFTYSYVFDQDISMWDTSNVVTMQTMFSNARIFNQDISNWNTGKVTNMSSMFYEAHLFNQPIGKWNMSSVTTISSMFYSANSFNQDLSNWNTSNFVDIGHAFRIAAKFNGNVGNWNVSKVTNMNSAFRFTPVFNQDLSNWNTSNVTNMADMFGGAQIFNGNITTWNTSKVTNMDGMFQDAYLFNQDISPWDVSKVTIMTTMFYNANVFNRDLSGWCVTNIPLEPINFTNNPKWTLPKPVWGTCPIRVPKTTPFSFNVVSSNDWVTDNNITLTLTAPVAGWSLKRDDIVVASATVITTPGIVVTTTGGNVTIVIEALRNESRGFEMAISATQVQMTYTANQPGMTVAVTSFSDAVAGYRLNVNALLTVPTVLPISVTSTANMFGGARKFNQDISMWDTSRVTNMSSMFNNAWLFNMPLNTWNTSKVTTMNSMFYSAKVFNQDISAWNVSKVADMNFFATDTAFNRDLSQWCVPLLDSAPSGFSVAAIHVLPKPVWGTCPRGENVAL